MAADGRPKAPFVPPRWVVRSFWLVHRAVYRLSRGRLGLWPARPGKWGTMKIVTIGRRSGRERTAILGYIEDGPNISTVAMNGWASPEPAWWLNLQAHPDVTIVLPTGPRQVRGRAAVGDERTRLWAAWEAVGDDMDGYSSRRSSETAIVVLEPRP
jgi:deazaflavin-dependent oxidoreductase (nitroreductase family)